MARFLALSVAYRVWARWVPCHSELLSQCCHRWWIFWLFYSPL